MRLRFLPAAAVVAALVAACGGSSAPTTTKKASTSHGSGSAKTTQSGGGSSSSGGGSSSSSGGGSSSSSGGGSSAFASASNCTQLAGVGEQFAKAMSSATSGGKFDMAAVVKAYHDLADAAPAAIRPDIQVLAAAFTTYASALSKSGYTFGKVPTPTQITAIEQAVKVFDQAKLKTATTHLQSWAAHNCK